MRTSHVWSWVGWWVVLSSLAAGQTRESEIRDKPFSDISAESRSALSTEDARSPEGNTKGGGSLLVPALQVETQDAAWRRAEEMEILRVMIQRQVEGVYAHPPHSQIALAVAGVDSSTTFAHRCTDCHVGGPVFRASGAGTGQLAATRTEIPSFPAVSTALGARIPRHGLVYQLAAPPPAPEPERRRAVGGASDSLSPWERVRQQLRGDVDPAPSRSEPAPPAPPTPSDPSHLAAPRGVTVSLLADALLAVLGDNGRHLEHLERDAHITVAVTFPRESGGGYGLRPGTDRESRLRGMGYRPRGGGSSSPYAEYADVWEPVQDWRELGNEARTLAQAAMLLSRRGEFKKAVESYEEAFRRATGRHWKQIRDDEQPIGSPPRPSLLPVHRELARALFHTKIRAGDPGTPTLQQALHDDLEKLQALAGIGEQESELGRRDAGNSIPLASQLMVSVTKEDCIQLASGKLTRDQFRQRAVVQYTDVAGP